MKYLIAILFSAFFYNSPAQDTAVLAVHYTFFHITDTAMPDKPHQENMVLQVSPNKSIYQSNDLAESEASRKAMIAASLEKAKAQGTTPFFDMTKTKKATREKIMREFSRRPIETIVISNFQQVDYLIKEESGAIDWIFTEEVRPIKGLTCQKAKGRFRGRLYEAWFCPELPYSSGPWKLSGLPGLIVEATDSLQQVRFILNKIEDLRDSKMVVALPGKGVWTSKADFDKMKNSYADAFFGGAINGANAKLKPVSGSAANNKLPRPNNPLELSDK